MSRDFWLAAFSVVGIALLSRANATGRVGGFSGLDDDEIETFLKDQIANLQELVKNSSDSRRAAIYRDQLDVAKQSLAQHRASVKSEDQKRQSAEYEARVVARSDKSQKAEADFIKCLRSVSDRYGIKAVWASSYTDKSGKWRYAIERFIYRDGNSTVVTPAQTRGLRPQIELQNTRRGLIHGTAPKKPIPGVHKLSKLDEDRALAMPESDAPMWVADRLGINRSEAQELLDVLRAVRGLRK